MDKDSAFTLKKAYDKDDKVSIKKAQNMLESSELVSKLLTDPKQKPHTFVGLRALEWRLLELCEVPYTHTLDKVQNWLEFLVNRTSISEGFSLTGERNGLLACHNAIITNILLKMGYDDKDKIDTGINWILDYQNVERDRECKWTGVDLFTKWGGCMKKTPCFYGVVKSVKTLTEYKERFGGSKKLDDKLHNGLEYILIHRVFKKLSDDKPIEPSIIENFYPYPYKTNIIETLSLLKVNGLLSDRRCKEAIGILKQKKRPDGFWQADTSFMKTAWVDFDEPKKPGLWISYIISELTKDKCWT